MKIHELRWSTIQPHLEVYEQLTPKGRAQLRSFQGQKSVDRTRLGGDLAALLDSGLVRPLVSLPKVVLTTEAQPVLVGLRAAERCKVLGTGSRSACTAYIQDSFTGGLRKEVLFDLDEPYGDHAQMLAERIDSTDWLKGLLAKDACARLKRSHTNGERGTEHIYTPAVRALVKRLVDALVEASGPVRVLDLATLLPGERPANLDRALQAALRYLLVFPGLERESGSFLIGLHPNVQARLGAPTVQQPEVLDMDLAVTAAPCLADLHHLVVAVAGSHVRVRADGSLFKKDADGLATSLAPTPTPTPPDPEAFAEPAHHVPSPPERVLEAFALARQLGLTRVGPDTGGRKRLVATDEGRAWIALPAQERLQYALERCGPRAKTAVLATVDAPENAWADSDAGPGWGLVFRGYYGILPYGTSHIPLRDACLDALRRLPTEGGVRREAFLNYAAGESNPLLGQGEHAHRLDLNPARGYWGHTSTEDREDAWRRMVRQAIKVHLQPWGGLRVGSDPVTADPVRDSCMGLTPLGAWMLGLTEAFPAEAERAAHAVVQPTFEIVFFEPDPTSAVELAPFCDRVGESVGVVFQITKESVARAAAAGIDLETIQETIARVSRTPVPGNVVKEIETWHGRQRVLVLRQPWVLDCGDKETADRVFAAASRKLERLSDTLLALRGKTKPDTVAKLLASHGVSLDTSHVPEPKKRAKRRRSRRSYW